MKRYGERIAFLREQQRMTQADFAAALGISRAALSHYETNRREPDYETMTKIADHFRVTTDYLLGRTDNKGILANPNPEPNGFARSLELSDEDTVQNLPLTVDGRRLTSGEAKRFVAFVRAHRMMK